MPCAGCPRQSSRSRGIAAVRRTGSACSRSVERTSGRCSWRSVLVRRRSSRLASWRPRSSNHARASARARLFEVVACTQLGLDLLGESLQLVPVAAAEPSREAWRVVLPSSKRWQWSVGHDRQELHRVGLLMRPSVVRSVRPCVACGARGHASVDERAREALADVAASSTPVDPGEVTRLAAPELDDLERSEALALELVFSESGHQSILSSPTSGRAASRSSSKGSGSSSIGFEPIGITWFWPKGWP